MDKPRNQRHIFRTIFNKRLIIALKYLLLLKRFPVIQNSFQQYKMIKKKWFFLILILLVGLFGLFQYQKYRVAPKNDFTKWVCIDTNGRAIPLTSFKNKKLILTFYASWCGDCLKEMKQLNETLKNNLKDVEVIAISDEPLEKVQAFAHRKKYPFTFLQLPKSFAEINIFAIPVTYIINSKNELVYSKVGAINWRDPAVISFTEENLKE